MKCDIPGCGKKATFTRSWVDNPKTLLTHANICDDCNKLPDEKLAEIFQHGTLSGLYGEMQLVLNSRPDVTDPVWQSFREFGEKLIPLWS